MLDYLRTTIVACLPELANASFTLLTMGWDAIAVDVDDRLIFKFPRDDDGIDALRREAAMLAVVRPHVTLPVPDLAFFDTPRPFSKHTKLKGTHLLTAQYEGWAVRQNSSWRTMWRVFTRSFTPSGQPCCRRQVPCHSNRGQRPTSFWLVFNPI